jgi:hypothetical protein
VSRVERPVSGRLADTLRYSCSGDGHRRGKTSSCGQHRVVRLGGPTCRRAAPARRCPDPRREPLYQISGCQTDTIPLALAETDTACAAAHRHPGAIATGGAVHAATWIRRLKAEILDQLPRKERGVAYVEPAASTPEQLHAVLDELAATEQKASTGDQQAASKVKALMSKAFHLTAVAKVPAVLAQCADIWRTGHKFLLFAYHELMLDAVEGWLREQQGTWIRIDGKTQVTERQALVDRFQDDPQCRVALLALTAAGAGLTLTAAHVVLFAELYWNPGTLRQAEDRVHRIGQKGSVPR